MLPCTTPQTCMLLRHGPPQVVLLGVPSEHHTVAHVFQFVRLLRLVRTLAGIDLLAWH